MSDPRLTVSQTGPRRAAGDAAPPAGLCAVAPAGLTWRVELEPGARVLGRDGTPPLEHGTVSRRHVEIGWNGAAHTARDLGSRNGARLDGERLGDRALPLTDGAVLQLGDVFLVYERIAESPDAAGEANVPGQSAAARRLRALVARAAPDPSAVLIVGETGTGKEWIAAELHRASGRPGPLVAVNCAALGANLVESQLFGHVKGAFTGAAGDQRGLFRAADGGTLFLDEIGEFPLELQPKLLRVLQDKQILPVGGTRAAAVDVRVIAATNRELTAEVEAGGFRRDLYARLALWEIAVPPLRARRADLLGWLARLHAAWATARGVRAVPIELLPDAVETILLHPWPDNLRGVDRLVHLLASAPRAHPFARADLPGWLTTVAEAPAPPAARARRESPSREEITKVFNELKGNVRAMARHFDRDRKQIYRWLAALGLKGDEG